MHAQSVSHQRGLVHDLQRTNHQMLHRHAFEHQMLHRHALTNNLLSWVHTSNCHHLLSTTPVHHLTLPLPCPPPPKKSSSGRPRHQQRQRAPGQQSRRMAWPVADKAQHTAGSCKATDGVGTSGSGQRRQARVRVSCKCLRRHGTATWWLLLGTCGGCC